MDALDGRRHSLRHTIKISSTPAVFYRARMEFQRFLKSAAQRHEGAVVHIEPFALMRQPPHARIQQAAKDRGWHAKSRAAPTTSRCSANFSQALGFVAATVSDEFIERRPSARDVEARIAGTSAGKPWRRAIFPTRRILIVDVLDDIQRADQAETTLARAAR